MHQLSILVKCYPLSLNVCLLLNCRINLPEVCPSKRSKHTSLELNIHSSALSSWFLNPLKYLKISVKHPPVGHSKGNLCKPVLKLVPLEKFCWKSSHKCWFNELIFFFFFFVLLPLIWKCSLADGAPKYVALSPGMQDLQNMLVPSPDEADTHTHTHTHKGTFACRGTQAGSCGLFEVTAQLKGKCENDVWIRS